MLTVSNYHYIRPDFTAKYPSIFGVTPAQFEAQLKLLKQQADFIHPNDLLDHPQEVLTDKQRYFFITFDDGLKEQFNHALPILDALNIPAIFFVNSVNFEHQKVTTVHKIHLLRSVLDAQTLLDATNRFSEVQLTADECTHAQSVYRYDDATAAALKYLLNFKMSFLAQEKFVDAYFKEHFNESEIHADLYMSAQQIQVLAQKGFLGSHTHQHYPIGLLPEAEMKFELLHSKTYLEKLTQTDIKMVSYPYGTAEACTDLTAKLAQEVGYEFGFTTHRGSNHIKQNALLLNRYDCNDLPGGKSYNPENFH